MYILDASERWIPGYEGLYSIDTDCNITSYHSHHRQPCPVSGTADKIGYVVIILTDKNKKRHTYRAHRLMAMVYLDIKPGLVVNHLNFDKTDNRLENLEAVTQRQNIAHSLEHKRQVFGKGENATYVKLNEEQVRLIRNLYIPRRVSYASLGRQFNVSASTIHKIISGANWGTTL